MVSSCNYVLLFKLLDRCIKRIKHRKVLNVKTFAENFHEIILRELYKISAENNLGLLTALNLEKATKKIHQKDTFIIKSILFCR